MLDPWIRWVQFHELCLRSEPGEAPYIPLSDLIARWKKRIKDKEAVKVIENDLAAIRIVDIDDSDPASIVLLLQYSDTRVTDPVFSNLDTGALRVEPKLEGEGVAVSAHVAISRKPHDKVGILYRLLLEEIPGLGRSRLSPFLKSELKEISRGFYSFTDEETCTVKQYLPAAEILGTPSKQLMDELDGGAVLQGVELVQLTRECPGVDEEGFYREESRHLKLVPYTEGAYEKISDLLKRIRLFALDNEYDNIKIRYKRPQGKQKTATMGSTIGDLNDALVLRDEQISSTEVLAQCEKKIIKSISIQMKALLKDK